MTHRQELLLGIVAIIIVVAGIYFFGTGRSIKGGMPSTKVDLAIPATPTAEVQAQLAASNGFQALVSYTDEGFAPSTLTIKKGDAIRFTNNSKEDLWVAATGASGSVYPGKTVDECGQSAFDSCRIIAPKAFWEFTFDTAGTWSYQNNRDTQMTAIIIVE